LPHRRRFAPPPIRESKSKSGCPRLIGTTIRGRRQWRVGGSIGFDAMSAARARLLTASTDTGHKSSELREPPSRASKAGRFWLPCGA
jgi:hypothetical protein